MKSPLEFFLQELAEHVRALPMSDAVVFLKGAIELTGEHPAMKDLRGTYIDLSSADDQLELIASGQMKLPFLSGEAAATQEKK